MDRLIRKMDVFFDKLGDFFAKLLDAPLSMWIQTANEPGNRVMLLVFLLAFAGGALYLVVSFLKAEWREKLRILANAVLVVLVLLVIFWFALGM